jgi:hypothetical protein
MSKNFCNIKFSSSATSRVVLHGSASIITFNWLSSIAQEDVLRPFSFLRFSSPLRNSFEPILSYMLVDGSLAKCLVDFANSFRCLTSHFEFIC